MTMRAYTKEDVKKVLTALAEYYAPERLLLGEKAWLQSLMHTPFIEVPVVGTYTKEIPWDVVVGPCYLNVYFTVNDVTYLPLDYTCLLHRKLMKEWTDLLLKINHPTGESTLV